MKRINIQRSEFNRWMPAVEWVAFVDAAFLFRYLFSVSFFFCVFRCFIFANAIATRIWLRFARATANATERRKRKIEMNSMNLDYSGRLCSQFKWIECRVKRYIEMISHHFFLLFASARLWSPCGPSCRAGVLSLARFPPECVCVCRPMQWYGTSSFACQPLAANAEINI